MATRAGLSASGATGDASRCASSLQKPVTWNPANGFALLEPSPSGPTTLGDQLSQPRDGGVGGIGERVHEGDERRVRRVLVLPVQLTAGRRLLEQLVHQVGRLAQQPPSPLRSDR